MEMIATAPDARVLPTATADTKPCVICGNRQTKEFVTIPQIPVLCNILWPSKEEATSVRRVDITLAFCSHCGHIFNPNFDPALMDYSQVYENSLHFSPRFQQFAETLAMELVARHALHDKTIIEISCGKGDFLQMLCAVGSNRGYGFDPSYVGDLTVQAGTGKITFIQDFYSEAYANYPADFLCCRHTLEHIEEPNAFLRMVRATIGEQQLPVYFEMPNALFTLRDLAIWDFIYEHCGYFSADSLRYLFQQHGFQVTDVQPTYEGQFLYIEALPTTQGDVVLPNAGGSNLADDVDDFTTRYQQKVATEAAKLAEIREAGQKAVIWGAGSKGITFLNVMQTQGIIDYAVDLNVRKQGMYITGSGQQIVAPDFLQTYQPDVIIVMNPIYMDEIQQMTADLGIKARFISA